ncbi:MAG: acyl carrier protein [Clostridia bacterium]|nr:acyl carrier protein [Clostridia bacterium]
MINEKVKELVAEQLGVAKDTISDDANIIEDLGADSLDVIEMLMTLEEEFGVTIPDDKINQIKTIKQIIELIEECQK